MRSLFVRLAVLSLAFGPGPAVAGESAPTSSRVENAGYLTAPLLTRAGVVCTDNFRSTLYRIDATGVVPLVSGPGIGLYATVSPDGLVLGVKDVGDEGLQAPALLDPATGRLRLLAPHTRQAGQVSFTADGRVGYTLGTDLIVDDGLSRRRYPLGAYANIAPLSPDGRRAAFNDADDQIWILDLATGTRERVSTAGRGYFAPSWSPDGSRLLYRGLAGTMHVYDPDSRKAVDFGRGDDPVWTADSRSILFHRTEVRDHRLIGSDLFRIQADGSGEVALTQTPDVLEMNPSPAGMAGTVLFHIHSGNEIRALSAARDGLQATPPHTVLARGAGLTIVPRQPAAAPPAGRLLDIPYVHQVYDTPDWFNGHWACAPTQAMMVLAYYDILPPWNITCSWPSRHVTPWGNYVADRYRFRQVEYSFSAEDPNQRPAMGGYGFMWTGSWSPHSRMATYFRNHGLSATQTEGTPYSTAAAEISGGFPFSMCVMLTSAGHLVLAHGFGSEPHTLVFNDPYGNKNQGYMNSAGKNVSYDWPGYNNGYQNLDGVAWCIATRWEAPAGADTLVDDLHFSREFTLATAPPASMGRWRDLTRGYAGHLWYAYTHTGSADTCFAEWRPALTAGGEYLVEAYVALSNATHARYRIAHAGGVDTADINQSLYRDAWVALGVFPFAAGTGGSIRLGDASTSAGQEIVFDAVRWTRVVPTAAGLQQEALPGGWALFQNYPNPFNPRTTIRWVAGAGESGAGDGRVTLAVYDILGREVEVLVDGTVAPGEHQVEFQAENLAGGVYYFMLHAAGTSITRFMVLAK